MNTSTTLTEPDLQRQNSEPTTFERPPLSTRRQVVAGVFAVALGALTWIPSGTVSPVRWVAASTIVFALAIYVLSRRQEGRRRAFDRVVTFAMYGAFAAVVVPLISLLYTVITRGAARFDAEFFTSSMRNVVGEGGGGYHAIVGTIIVTGLATIMSVPVGIMVAVYLVEYGNGKLSKLVTVMVDVMTGIPSIVAGLFAYALFVIFQGPGARSGLAGAVALAVLMTPVVIRATEEMLKLVPMELREASYALGVPKWKTIVRVVMPTAVAGILTGITLAIARVIGETAPLLVAAGIAQDANYNPFSGRMTTLPVQAYYGYQTPGLPAEAGYDRAWTAALALIIIVVFLFALARVIATVFQPKGLR